MNLEATRQRLEDMLREHDESVAQFSAASEDDSQRSADGGEALTTADRNRAVLDSIADQRAQVVAALGRIHAGSYGTCAQCGATLPEERLEARPEAALCVSCQSKAESR